MSKVAESRRRQLCAARLAVLAGEAKGLLTEFPQFRKLFIRQIVADRRAPPDGASMAAARTTIIAEAERRLDRLEESDRLDIDHDDTEPLDQLQLTAAEWEFLKAVILPELFAARPTAKKASTEPVGSPGRIEDMAERQERGEDLYHPEDAKLEDRTLETCERANGEGLKILGWGLGPPI